MGKIKRVKAPKQKSILLKGKHYYRNQEEAAAARSAMESYAPQKEDYELVELMAANKIKKSDIAHHFRISETTFDQHFGDQFARGKMRANMKVTQTLFHAATGHEGLYDKAKRKWVVRPRAPDMTAVIWWDKTRGGWSEKQEVKHTGNQPRSMTQVVIYLPPNGREAGAAGDPTFVTRPRPALIDAKAQTVKAKAGTG